MFNGFFILPPLIGILSTKKAVFMIYQPSEISFARLASIAIENLERNWSWKRGEEDGDGRTLGDLFYNFCACKFAIINYREGLERMIIIYGERLSGIIEY